MVGKRGRSPSSDDGRPSKKQRPADGGDQQLTASTSSTSPHDTSRATPTGIGGHHGEGSADFQGSAIGFVTRMAQGLMAREAQEELMANPTAKGIQSILEMTDMFSRDPDVDQQIDNKMAEWDLAKRQQSSSSLPKETSTRHNDVPQASTSHADVRTFFRGDNATETVSFVTIRDRSMLAQGRELWNIRVKTKVRAFSSAQNEPGIHFTHDKIEIFLPKEAYMDLNNRSQYNNFARQIEQKMEELAPSSINSIGQLSALFSHMRNGMTRYRTGKWDTKVVDMTKDDFK